MPSAADLTPDSRFVALFVGPKHGGKTVAAASFDQPAEILDFDQRIRGLLGAPWIDRSRIHYESFPPRELGMVNRLNTYLENMLMIHKQGQYPYNTVVADSLTAETYAMLCQAMGFTHTSSKEAKSDNPKKGKFVGPLAMSGPEDYGFEAQATYDLLSFLRSIPIKNVIVTAHVVDKYGKEEQKVRNQDGSYSTVINPYSDSIVIGEKLSLRDKISANIGIYFDHIFRFDRRMEGSQERFFVQFRGQLACTSYAELPTGEFDITGKNFADFMRSYLKKGTTEKIQVVVPV